MNESGVFTNVLWYLEFFAFAAILISFFCWVLYLASVNYVKYGPKYDFRKKKRSPGPERRFVAISTTVDNKPVCCDMGCVWFCSVMFSIVTIGLCYYLAYTLLSDTKLRFGVFMP